MWPRIDESNRHTYAQMRCNWSNWVSRDIGIINWISSLRFAVRASKRSHSRNELNRNGCTHAWMNDSARCVHEWAISNSFKPNWIFGKLFVLNSNTRRSWERLCFSQKVRLIQVVGAKLFRPPDDLNQQNYFRRPTNVDTIHLHTVRATWYPAQHGVQ